MTKKVLSLLVVGAVATTLVGCGFGKKEEAKTSCEAYLDYIQCSVEKTGVSEEQIKAAVDKTKAGFDVLPEEQREAACTQAVEAIKAVPAIEGCELPTVTGEEKEVTEEEETTTGDVEVATENAAEEVVEEFEDAIEEVEGETKETEVATGKTEETEKEVEKTVEKIKEVTEETK